MANLTKLTSQVLIADDNRFMRTVLRDILKEDGYGIIEACNGLETLELFERYQPELVLLDIIMPEIDGCSVCSKLRCLPGGKNVPVLILTTVEDADTINNAFAAGADDYITKKFNPLVLRHRIKRLIEAEHDRKMAERLAWIDRLNLIGEVAVGIGHEVRNPMTTVRGFLQFLGNKEEFIKQRSYFELMIEELDRANAIITQFLTLAKDKSMDFAKLKLSDVVCEVYPMLQADALLNSCNIVLQLEEDTYVIVDKHSIRQLILNMIRNAIEAMPQGGAITVSINTDSGRVLLSIKDTGVGMPADLINKIGTPFVTTKETGSGLGLAICYRIAQRHGAEISVRSSIGNGTTFTVSFNQAS